MRTVSNGVDGWLSLYTDGLSHLIGHFRILSRRKIGRSSRSRRRYTDIADTMGLEVTSMALRLAFGVAGLYTNARQRLRLRLADVEVSIPNGGIDRRVGASVTEFVGKRSITYVRGQIASGNSPHIY